jgi:hypothetical protein
MCWTHVWMLGTKQVRSTNTCWGVGCTDIELSITLHIGNSLDFFYTWWCHVLKQILRYHPQLPSGHHFYHHKSSPSLQGWTHRTYICRYAQFYRGKKYWAVLKIKHHAEIVNISGWKANRSPHKLAFCMGNDCCVGLNCINHKPINNNMHTKPAWLVCLTCYYLVVCWLTLNNLVQVQLRANLTFARSSWAWEGKERVGECTRTPPRGGWIGGL